MKELIDSSKKIIVFSGAGISTNSGIPDFRGEGGLYERVQDKYDLPYGEAIFDLNYFDSNPHPFFDLSREIVFHNAQPTLCHKWLARLEEEGRIAKIITQNIDRLHRKAGSQAVLECHGGYDKGRCRSCGMEYDFENYEKDIQHGRVPHCRCGGVVKPNVVFFGESLPEEFFHVWENPPRGDLLLVLGTSLNVRPAADLALKFTGLMPSILVNLEVTDHDNRFTHVIHEDLDSFVKSLGN
ncbi:MAG: Sir2 family NAD-dependent protein deacetylase [Spirochaetales bacterium]|nr:Sir2 family NAD-dependent protein deacetylase [Spirochaetales bacterium]